MTTFDMTVDFCEPGALEAELQAAAGAEYTSGLLLALLPEDESQPAQLFTEDEECNNVKDGDLYATGCTIAELAQNLRDVL